MGNWALVTTKKNLEDFLKETASSVAAEMEVLASSGNEMSSTVNEISINLQKANEITTSIASAVEEQSVTANEMSENMAKTSQGTEEIAQSIKQVFEL